jgi:hypothetical protein
MTFEGKDENISDATIKQYVIVSRYRSEVIIVVSAAMATTCSPDLTVVGVGRLEIGSNLISDILKANILTHTITPTAAPAQRGCPRLE